MDKKIDVSVVIPVYNEEESINRCFNEVDNECKKLGRTYEIIYVNDGSKDNSLNILKELAEKYPQVKVINFSRNFGQNPALMAGFKMSSGEAIINIDCDLQDPVHLITDFVNKWSEGYDVVLAKRKKRAGESVFKKVTSKIFYKVFKWLSKTNTPQDCGISRLLSRRVLNDILQLNEHNIYLAGMTEYVGYKQTIVEFDREPRREGKTKYNVKKLVKLAISNTLPYSSTPIAFIFGGGITMSLMGTLGLITLLVLSLVKVVFPSLLWIIGTIVLCTGIIMASLGVIGAYIMMSYTEVLNRPRYIIADKYNFGDKDE